MNGIDRIKNKNNSKFNISLSHLIFPEGFEKEDKKKEVPVIEEEYIVINLNEIDNNIKNG
mgnify:CR=1 FL=1